MVKKKLGINAKCCKLPKLSLLSLGITKYYNPNITSSRFDITNGYNCDGHYSDQNTISIICHIRFVTLVQLTVICWYHWEITVKAAKSHGDLTVKAHDCYIVTCHLSTPQWILFLRKTWKLFTFLHAWNLKKFFFAF